MTISTKARVGSVFEIPLPDGRFAYGRVYKDATVAIYHRLSDTSNNPPIGERNFLFFVGMYERILRKGEWKVVGLDPFELEEDAWPPANSITDPIDGSCEIYHKGVTTPASQEACRNLEPAAVWDSNHIIDRILHGDKSQFLRSIRNR
jgi:hypothetical protein